MRAFDADGISKLATFKWPISIPHDLGMFIDRFGHSFYTLKSCDQKCCGLCEHRMELSRHSLWIFSHLRYMWLDPIAGTEGKGLGKWLVRKIEETLSVIADGRALG